MCIRDRLGGDAVDFQGAPAGGGHPPAAAALGHQGRRPQRVGGEDPAAAHHPQGVPAALLGEYPVLHSDLSFFSAKKSICPAGRRCPPAARAGPGGGWSGPNGPPDRGPPPGRGARRRRPPPQRGAVSYTHLDVYKRQSHQSAPYHVEDALNICQNALPDD